MSTELTIKAGKGAFGDGQHPTTHMLLEALHALSGEAPRRALDIGCGSGILAIFIAAQWGCPVIATDIEAESIIATRENARINGVNSHITTLQLDGFDHGTIKEMAPFDLITMNILAAPLQSLAYGAVQHLANDGVIMLSGMQAHEAPVIAEIYTQLGLELLHKISLDGWYALIFSKPAQPDAF